MKWPWTPSQDNSSSSDLKHELDADQAWEFQLNFQRNLKVRMMFVYPRWMFGMSHLFRHLFRKRLQALRNVNSVHSAVRNYRSARVTHKTKDWFLVKRSLIVRQSIMLSDQEHNFQQFIQRPENQRLLQTQQRKQLKRALLQKENQRAHDFRDRVRFCHSFIVRMRSKKLLSDY